MSKKNKKIAYIVLGSILGVCGIAYLVLYCLFKENTQKYTWLTIDYICNKPLPVIGISVLALAFIVYKIIKFVVNNKNTKINVLKDRISKLENELANKDTYIKTLNDKIENKTELIVSAVNDIYNGMYEICRTVPNKKVNELGDKFYVNRQK